MDSQDPLECLGVGMAFGFYYYLKDGPFTDLRQRLESFENFHKIELQKSFRKVLILIPSLCYCKIDKFTDLKRLDNLQTVEKNVAGTKDRPYKLTVYKSEETNQHYMIDMAQCLDAIERITIKREPLSDSQKIKITDQFTNTLSYLLKNDKECEAHYKILKFEDGSRFSDVLNNCVPTKTVEPVSLNKLGQGLAYWYYYNYIILTEPDLLDKMKDWENLEGVPLADKRVYILVPKSCFIPDEIIKIDDDGIEYAKDLDNNQAPPITVGASYGRVYKKNVLLVKNDDEKKPQRKFCIAEFATPIRQMYRMYNSSVNEMNKISSQNNTDKDHMDNQRHQFVFTLRALLKKENVYRVISYQDPENFKLSSLLLQKVKSRL